MLLPHSHPSFPPNSLTTKLPPPFFSTFPKNPSPQNPKPSSKRPIIFCSKTHDQTAPKSAIKRIAEKLRSLGYTEQNPPKPRPESEQVGEIFVPLPKQLPKHRVGYTIDSSWSTPQNPVPEPGSGREINRFHVLNNVVEREKRVARKEERESGGSEKVPTLAELKLSKGELRRLQEIGIKIRKKLKVGKAGITEGIVNGIHERWRRTEVVKIACEDLCKLNMKRTHDLLEVGI